MEEHNIPNEYKPISPIGYIGYQILFSIPVVGFIMLLIYRFGNFNNINLKNFVKSYLYIYFAIFLISFLIVLLSFLGFTFTK